MDLELTNIRDQTNLTSIFSSKKSMSLELNSNDTVDFNALSTGILDFVSVTWIGNFREYSPNNIPPVQLAEQLISRNITVLLHITCRNLDKVSALNILKYIKSIGVRNILALEGESRFVTERDLSKLDFPYTSFFVEFIKQNFANYFTIGVTGYPQKHPRSPNVKHDMEFLQLKVSKGADFIMTQGCLDKRIISDFYNLCKNFSICLPIVVGAFILKSPDQLDILKRCKIPVEDDISRFQESLVNETKSFETYFRDRLREIGEMIFDGTTSELAGIHLFSSNYSNYILDIMEEFTFFAKKFQHI